MRAALSSFCALMLVACDDAPAPPEDAGDDDASSCVPEAETCNGEDDNCDGDIDNRRDDEMCPMTDGEGMCVNGSCVVAGCADLNAWDCNGDFADGCEADLTSWRTCGNCETMCGTGAACIDGACDEDAVRSLATGNAHTCARTASGHVYCWGSNSAGQLGVALTGGQVSTYTPQLVPGPVADVVSLAASADYTCVVKANGTVWCWGTWGSVGSTPTAVSAFANVVQISAGTAHLCAIDMGGDIYCAGDNSSGQIDGTAIADTREATKVLGLTDTSPAIQVSAGGAHSCAVLEDGAAYCWGSNNHGQLAAGLTASQTPPSGVQEVDSDSFPVYSVVTGTSHSCFLRATTGYPKVHCAGGNGEKELGIEGPDRIDVRSGAVSTGATSGVFARGAANHSCYLTAARSLYCWGSNGSGQLGIGSTNDAIATLLSISDVTNVALGGEHTCALTTAGQVYCWGKNSSSQLGFPGSATSSPGSAVSALP